jgi:glycosyltransferase involved in cell wall biosynthesis
MRPASDSPAISVVVPVHNERDNVGPLHAEIARVLEVLGEPSEIIFVNDGSTDDTRACLAQLERIDPRLRVLDLDGNFGEAAALTAGFHRARGHTVITLDGDGQNDPADIPRLLERLRHDDLAVVSGRRVARQEDFWLRVLPSRLANALIVHVTGVPVYDCGCGLKAYRRSAIPTGLHLPRGMNRFLPAIFGVQPGAVAEVAVGDRARQHGRSHYGLRRTIIVLRDLLALRAIIRSPRRAEVRFALATAGAAAVGALVAPAAPSLMLLCDAVAVGCGLVWWNVRRFNRAQDTGVYRLRDG